VSRAARGRSSIHRRSHGPGWEGWVDLGVHPVSGKRWRKHVRGATKTEVAGKIAALEKAREARAIAWDHTTTLDAWLQSWLAGRVSAGLRPNTVAGYRTDLKYVTRSGVGRVRLRDLTAEHMERVYSYILGLPRAGPGSVAHAKRTLNAALNTAVQRGHMARNPTRGTAAPRHAPPALQPYTQEEIRRLLTAAADRDNGVRWSLAVLGLRQGEVLGLRWRDLDLDSGELTVRHTLTWLAWRHGCSSDGECGKQAARCPQRHGGGAHLGPPKSDAGRRTISLPQPVIAQLHHQRRQQAAQRLAADCRWPDHDFVITNTTGGPVDRTSDREQWHRLLAAAGLRRLRIHDLRHSAATALLVMGEDSRVLLSVMGWTSMSLVQRYTHLISDLHRAVAQRQTTLWITPTD
jgi:integrase